MENRYFELGITLVVIIVLLLIRTLFRVIIKKHAEKYDLDIGQRKYANKFFNFVFSILLFVLLGIIWDVSVKGLSIYFASFFTVVGVALFANWSILSNITSSIILFFNSPFKIGSTLTIMDKDDSVTGVVLDITFFSIQIQTADGDIISYPNSLAMQKPIKHVVNK
jgi:MscS family membrane protein